MSIHIINNKEPNLRRPVFLVDGKLEPRLDDYEITKLMNKSNFVMFLGPAGSGKTSMIVSLLNTPTLFKKVFHTIYLIMGSNSRASIKDNFFEKNIPPEQLYDELTVDNLNDIYEKIKEDADDGYLSLIILDDVQKDLKDKNVEKLLLNIINNRRHLKTSIWMANQNYRALSKQVRMGLSNIFSWKVKKAEIQNLLEEQIELPRDKFNDVLKLCFKDRHDFLFTDTVSQRLFCNWDEIVIDD